MAKRKKKIINMIELKEDAECLFSAFFYTLDKTLRPSDARQKEIIDKDLLQVLADFLEYRQKAEKERAKNEKERKKIREELLRLKQQYLPTFKEYIDSNISEDASR